jgi:hypothetical protein
MLTSVTLFGATLPGPLLPGRALKSHDTERNLNKVCYFQK